MIWYCLVGVHAATSSLLHRAASNVDRFSPVHCGASARCLFQRARCLFLDRIRDSRAIGSAKSVRCHPTRHSSGASSPTRGRFTASREEKNGTIRACWNQAVSRPPQIAGARVRFAAGHGERATASPEIFFGCRASSDSSLLFLLNVKKAVAALLSTSSLARPQPYSLHSLVNAVRGVREYQGRRLRRARSSHRHAGDRRSA